MQLVYPNAVRASGGEGCDTKDGAWDASRLHGNDRSEGLSSCLQSHDPGQGRIHRSPQVPSNRCREAEGNPPRSKARAVDRDVSASRPSRSTLESPYGPSNYFSRAAAVMKIYIASGAGWEGDRSDKRRSTPRYLTRGTVGSIFGPAHEAQSAGSTQSWLNNAPTTPAWDSLSDDRPRTCRCHAGLVALLRPSVHSARPMAPPRPEWTFG